MSHSITQYMSAVMYTPAFVETTISPISELSIFLGPDTIMIPYSIHQLTSCKLLKSIQNNNSRHNHHPLPLHPNPRLKQRRQQITLSIIRRKWKEIGVQKSRILRTKRARHSPPYIPVVAGKILLAGGGESWHCCRLCYLYYSRCYVHITPIDNGV